jgi:hypothetical protein
MIYVPQSEARTHTEHAFSEQYKYTSSLLKFYLFLLQISYSICRRIERTDER